MHGRTGNRQGMEGKGEIMARDEKGESKGKIGIDRKRKDSRQEKEEE